MRVIPGDPALLILAGTSGDGSFKKADLLKLRAELGTDRPLHVQYGTWLWGLAHGDLGYIAVLSHAYQEGTRSAHPCDTRTGVPGGADQRRPGRASGRPVGRQ